MSNKEDKSKDVRISLRYETENGEPLLFDEYPDVLLIHDIDAEYLTEDCVKKAIDDELALRGLNHDDFVMIWRVIDPPFSLTVH